MEKRWTLKPSGDKRKVELLSEVLNINPILANLLVQRGVTTFHEAKKFFRPEITDLHDPFLMKDMDKAIDRIIKAIHEKEKILIYGDYDVDGTTSVALVYSFLENLHPFVEYYLPDRYKEGYGVSFAGVDWAKEHGYTLIIALDCGIKANDKVDYASQLGIDFIICDHHIPGEELPKAEAVLDPKRMDCPYPYKELTGCGIGFKLIHAFAETQGLPFSEVAGYLDLVVVSIASDIVPVTGENRILAYFGLDKLNTHPRPGFKAILELTKTKRKLTITDVVFIIGPRINAAGRIEDAKRSVELMISENPEEALSAGKGLNLLNTERKELDSTITEQALQLIREDLEYEKKKTTVLFNPQWHKGVLGIVASRLTEHHYRPTIVLTQSGETISGSARSVKDFDIYVAIEKCSDLLEQFGGHKFAAGLTMKPENVKPFSIKFDEVVSSIIEEKMLTQEIEVDAEINLSDVSFSFFKILKQFAPFGPGNLSPVFVTNNILSRGPAKIVGANHMKFFAHQPPSPSFDAIAFQQADQIEKISEKNPFQLCYHLEENEWNGQIVLQLNVKDIKLTDS